MTIATNIGNFENWFSVACEMENTGIKTIKVNDVLCLANTTHLGAIIGEITIDEAKEFAKNEIRRN